MDRTQALADRGIRPTDRSFTWGKGREPDMKDSN